MKVLSQNDLPPTRPTAVAVGLFDGLHEGHKTLIRDILQQRERGLASLVYTFDSKPNHAAYKNIYTLEEKEKILQCMQVDALFLQPFDGAFASLSKQEFLERLICDFHAKHITVGFDFHFGKNAAGDADYLCAMGEKYGYTVSIMPRVTKDGHKVSSSDIRRLILEGDMRKTADLLTRFYFVDGIIERGNHLGAKIGFPTANISTDKLLPKYGVYATIVQLDGKLYRSVTNVGIKPTVKDDDVPNVETFILDFSGQVYDEHMRVYFVEKIRDERAFPNVEALRREIAANTETAGEILRNLDIYKKYVIC